MGPRRVVFLATGNIHKFNEARRVLAEFGLSVALLRRKTWEIQHDHLEQIAREAVRRAVEETRLPLIVEDAGLFIGALGGFPGPYSSYVFRTIGCKGILKLMEGVEERDAYFESVVAFCRPGGEPICFHGRVDGRITPKERGTSGFGFDPIFEPLEAPGKTFGEMTIKEKNRYSHRARALRRFAQWYTSNL